MYVRECTESYLRLCWICVYCLLYRPAQILPETLLQKSEVTGEIDHDDYEMKSRIAAAGSSCL